MLKFRLYLDKDDEEDWLREMSLKGWAFKKFFLGFCTFDKCEPGEYNYQIDILDNWKGDKKEYAAFMEDAGVKVISQWWRWVYLQKKASDGPFEMYTDIDSKITQYSKISKFLSIFLPIEFFGFLYELFGAIYLKSYILAVFAVALAIISLSILKIIWKCKWKIKEYKKQENV